MLAAEGIPPTRSSHGDYAARLHQSLGPEPVREPRALVQEYRAFLRGGFPLGRVLPRTCRAHDQPGQSRRCSARTRRRGPRVLRILLLRPRHARHANGPTALRRRRFDVRDHGRLRHARTADGPASARLVRCGHVFRHRLHHARSAPAVEDSVHHYRAALGLHPGLDRNQGHRLRGPRRPGAQLGAAHYDPDRLLGEQGRHFELPAPQGRSPERFPRHARHRDRLLRHGRSGGRRLRHEQPQPQRHRMGRTRRHRPGDCGGGRPAPALGGRLHRQDWHAQL